MVSLRLAAVCVISLVLLASCGGSATESSGGPERYREPRCEEGDENRQYNDPEEIRGALEGLRRYRRYRLYHLGLEHAGLPLTGVVSDCQPPAYEPAIYPPDRRPPPISPAVSFIYGTCEPSPGSEGRCAPPLAIQNYEVCAVSPHSLRVVPQALRQRIRGAPYLIHDGMSLYTGTTTIKVYGRRPMRAAARLRSVDGQIGPKSRLPPPVPGALAGRLRCRG